MSGFIEGENRYQATMFPERVDDYVEEDSVVRVIDVFIDRLDISGLGFKTEPADTGRPGYHPRTMLKIYVYGYLNRVQSSRRLEREAKRNVELMWLTGRLAPDFKTIADFRKDNGEAIRLVCREFVLLCRKLNLIGDSLAIDGSKFKAVNARSKNFSKNKLKKRIAEVEASIEDYMAELDQADASAPPEDTRSITEKLAALEEEMDRLKKFEVRRRESPDGQLSLTDPDARSMKGRGASTVGYNVHTVVDTEHHLIVAHEVTNQANERQHLTKMALAAKSLLEVDQVTVFADRGYYSGKELKACEDNDIVAYVPTTATFKYIAEDDEYECPAGERAIYRGTYPQQNLAMRRYFSSACRHCPIKARCTTSVYRRINRWVHQDILDRAEARLASRPEAMLIRRAVVEHPYGTIKQWAGSAHFLTKTLPKVSTEMSLQVLAYNMKRVINLIGTKGLIEAIG
jgi:transposase